MSEIGTLSLERLNNGAHFLFISNVLGRAEADTNIKSKLSTRIASLKAAKEKKMLESSASMQKMFKGRDSILNQPVYFFFKRRTSKLTDESQFVNLDEIARVENYHDITFRIDGAADSSIGSKKGN